jgi:hypothetical protein
MVIENLDDFIPVIDSDIFEDIEQEDVKLSAKEDKTSEEESEEEYEDTFEDEHYSLDDDEESEEEEDGEEEEGQLPNLPVADEKASAKAIASVLQEMGLLNPEKDIESYDDVEELLKTQAPQSLANAMIDELPDYGKNLALFVLSKGSDLTKDDLKDFYMSFFEDELMESLQDFSEDTIEDAKSFLRNEYKAKGLKDSTINKTLDALEIEEELLEEANSMLKEKKKLSKSAYKAQEASKQSTEKKIDEVQFIKQIRSEVNETKWKPERQKKVLDIIANNKIKDVISDAINNPKSLVAFANLLSYYDFEKKEFDLTDFVNQKATQEVEKTKSSIFRDAIKSAGSGGGDETPPKKSKKKILPEGFRPIL